jgi:tetratricopeptide (TPR) repeat protein
MSFSGDLRGIGLADVFQNVAANRLDGTLCIRWRREERYVRFEGGAVRGFSLGVGRGLPLADHLRARGHVERAELERVLTRGKRSRKPVTLLCVEAGLLDDEGVRRAMTECVEEHLFALFSLRDAEFRFDEGPPPARVFDSEQGRVGMQLPIGPMLMEAARRRDEAERFQKVVTSDEDVFVLLEGFEERIADDLGLEIAGLLDGRTSVGAIAEALGAAPFHVRKAVYDLAQAGAARPSTADELAEAADEVLAAGEKERALGLMEQALDRSRSDAELRARYAVLLEDCGRLADAAVEQARLGHDAEREEDFAAARSAYEHALALTPDDLALHERHVALLERCGGDDELVAASLGLVGRHAAIGLADRSRGLLAGVIERRGLGDREELVRALARVESSLGHWREAAAWLRGLGERRIATGAAGGLALLRDALDQDPENGELRALVEGLESGQLARRRVRRRWAVGSVSAAAVLAAVGLVGIAELRAARGAAFALGAGLGDLSAGEGVAALERLTAVAEDYGWTRTGTALPDWIGRVTDLQLEAVREHLRAARYDLATGICAELVSTLGREDLRATCAALLERIERERSAHAVLNRITRRDRDLSAADLAELEGLGRPEHLEFLIARLPEVRDHAVRAALLRAVARVDDPRSFPAVARLMLRAQDESTQVAARHVLARAAAHRHAGRETEWVEVYDELERALEDPGRAGVARDALTMLRGS